ncbi:MAG TPA: adenosine deaminase, partial [Thermoanaerobaculia bacterium]
RAGNRAAFGITELHLHLEGSLSAESCVDIAKIRSHRWGAFSPHQLQRTFNFNHFSDFLDAIREMCRLLASADVLERAARELSLFLTRYGVDYAEVYCSPYIYVRWGLDYGEVLRGIDRGFATGEEEGGAYCAILIDTVRQWGCEAAEIVLDGAEQNRSERIVGFGIGGEETLDLSEFAGVFERARKLGLKTIAHAGEGAGSTEVWKAIDILGVDRVAHGIRALDDERLLHALAKRRIPLDIAVTSNYRTKVVRSTPHPIRELIDHGVVTTLSTDDPSLFRTDPVREYARARRFGQLSEAELQTIARNGVEASFATEERKERLRKRLGERFDDATVRTE